jgi:hypothetical protein
VSDPRHALLSAIHGVLMADGWLDGVLAGGKVYDRVPRGAAHPFVVFGEMTSEPLDADPPVTVEHRFDVLVYSREAGQREASDVAERIRALLDGAGLLLAGFRLVSLRHRNTAVSVSPDRRAYRARLSFRALTEQS